MPGVVAVGGSKTLPLHGGGEPYEFGVPGRPDMHVNPESGAFLVTPGYFRALGIRLLRGRVFTDADTIRPEVVVNQALARQVWPGQDAVGRQLSLGRTNVEVIGVVADVRSDGLTRPAGSAAYVTMHFAPRSTAKLFVRTAGSPLAMAGAVRQAIWQVNPAQPVSEMMTLDRMVTETVAQPRLLATLLALFSGLALVLAVVGLYGVIAYNVAQRTREIGIRMALGADRRAVLRGVVGHTARLTGAGMVLGVLAALVLTRVLAAQLYGVQPTDLATFTAVLVLLGVVALLAGYLPARRAAGTDPMSALRYE